VRRAAVLYVAYDIEARGRWRPWRQPGRSAQLCWPHNARHPQALLHWDLREQTRCRPPARHAQRVAATTAGRLPLFALARGAHGRPPAGAALGLSCVEAAPARAVGRQNWVPCAIMRHGRNADSPGGAEAGAVERCDVSHRRRAGRHRRAAGNAAGTWCWRRRTAIRAHIGESLLPMNVPLFERLAEDHEASPCSSMRPSSTPQHDAP
jgi:hypothetical protein